MDHWLLILLTACFSFLFQTEKPLHAQTAPKPSITVSMRSDLSQVSLNETFRLQIRVDAVQLKPEKIVTPDFSNFTIVGTSSSQPSSGMQVLFNGQFQVIRQSSTLKTFVLKPTQKGLFKIEPAKVIADGKTYSSAPLEIEVLDADGGAPNPTSSQSENLQAHVSSKDSADFDSKAFVRMTVDNASPFVGEQITVSVYIFVKDPLASSPVVTKEPSASAFWVQNLLAGSRTLEATYQNVRGIPFRAYLLRQFAAFPLKEGTLSISGAEVEIETGSFFTRPRRFKRKGGPLELKVQPLPKSNQFPNAVVGEFSVKANLDRTQAIVGDALTFKIQAEGSGSVRNTQFQFPKINGLRILKPQTENRSEIVSGKVRSQKSTTWIIVPQAPGTYTIPSFDFTRFDPKTEKYTTHSTSPYSLIVEGSPIPSSNAIKESASGKFENTKVASPNNSNSTTKLSPFRTKSELLRKPHHQNLPVWLFLVSFIPFFLWVASKTIPSFLKRASSGSSAAATITRIHKELLESTSHLSKMNYSFSCTQSSQLIRQAIEAFLDQPTGSFTFAELNKKLIQSNVSEQEAASLVTLLEFFEQGRFSPSQESAAGLETKMNEAIKLLLVLGKKCN